MKRKNKPFACVESITSHMVGLLDGKVRVWREIDGPYGEVNNSDVTDTIFKLGFERGMAELGEKIARLPRVNAVEVLDRNGNGIVIYPEWP